MASKQQQLRAMMKKAQQQGQGGENLSAIEKARLMKALRKKQKEEQESQRIAPTAAHQQQQAYQASSEGFVVPSAPKAGVAASQKKVISASDLTSKAPAGLPPGFFDNDAPTAPAAAPAVRKAAPTQATSILGATYGDASDEEEDEHETTHAQAAPQSRPTEPDEGAAQVAAMPSLPKGFFDSPEEEMQVQQVQSAERGRQQDRTDDTALQAFLADVSQVEVPDEEEGTPDEEDWQEIEQMAYQSRLAKLLIESEQVLQKRKHQGEGEAAPAITSEAIHSMLEEVEEVVQPARTSEDTEQGKQVEDLIQQGLMRRKKKKSKHDEESDAPLDLFDWRARAL